MNKVLVVVYSYTGTSRRVADLLGGQQGWPVAEIRETHARRGAFGSLRCILDALLRRRPAIRYDGPPPGQFDAVVLVSPIWMLRLAGPMRSFLALHGSRLPNVAVLSVRGSRGASNAVVEVGALLGREPMLSAAVTMREVDEGSYAAQLQAFGTAIGGEAHSHIVVRPVTLSPHST